MRARTGVLASTPAREHFRLIFAGSGTPCLSWVFEPLSGKALKKTRKTKNRQSLMNSETFPLATAILAFWCSTDTRALGQTWTPSATAPITNWSSVASSADGMRLVAAAGELVAYPGGPGNPAAPIYVSTNAGAQWNMTTAPFLTWQAVASSADGTNLAAVAYSGEIYLSQDGGSNWSSNGPVAGANWGTVASSADGKTLAVAAVGGGIYFSLNQGTSWSPSDAPSTNWLSISSSADGSRLVAAQPGDYLHANGAIYLSTNSGLHWTLSTAPAAEWFSVASSADGRRLVAASFHTNSTSYPGLIYLSADYGANWTPSSAPPEYWTAVASSADGRRLVAAGSGALFTSTDFGLSWSPANVPYQYWVSTASSADGGMLAALASLNRIYTLSSPPAPWLTSAAAGGNLVLSWTVPSTSLVLRQNADLMTANWYDSPYPGTLVVSSLQYQVVVPMTNPANFFRLESR